jgi:hypothetical protein
MTGFVIWAALCAAGAALCVAWPPLRARQERPSQSAAQGPLPAPLPILAASVLYPLWSHYPRARRRPRTMNPSEPLLKATLAHPEDLHGWLNLVTA